MEESTTLVIPERPERQFLPADLKIESWNKVESYFEDLKNRKLDSLESLEKWLQDWSEVEAVFDEDASWRYIRMTCDTTNDSLVRAYDFYVSEIEPKISPYYNDFSKKLISSPFLGKLDKEKYRIFLRTIRKNLEIFREENIPLTVEIAQESQKYGSISARMTVDHEGKELTLQQAANFQKDPERAVREKFYRMINARRGQDENQLNDLLSRLIKLRHKVAVNAGFKNFRDYKHTQMGRFDYSVKDCFSFHDSVAAEIVPVIEWFDRERKTQLKLDTLRPWDLEVDTFSRPGLRPFADADELISKSISCFNKVDRFFAERLEIMRVLGYFDLQSRIGKAPGGYNSTLSEIGVPFIFMNSAGSQRDLVTMVHEGGHAIQSFLMRDLELTRFKDIPSEIAELASMSMELISMEHWGEFYPDKEDLKRAKLEQLEKVLRGLAWIARVDMFQHWLYEHPEHTHGERNAYWVETGKKFLSKEVNWTGLEDVLARSWQGQLHIFEVPFYYIEYGFAQLGAIAVWRNYKKEPSIAINNYKKALALGYTRSIPEMYETAGIRFDFSKGYVKELADFVMNEYKKASV